MNPHQRFAVVFAFMLCVLCIDIDATCNKVKVHCVFVVALHLVRRHSVLWDGFYAAAIHFVHSILFCMVALCFVLGDFIFSSSPICC